jgi:hypothetical protein
MDAWKKASSNSRTLREHEKAAHHDERACAAIGEADYRARPGEGSVDA